jgi:hypothetical protein
MRLKLGYTQAQLSIISGVGDTGLYAQVFGGFGIQHYGIRTIFILSALLIWGGNFYVWLAVQKRVCSDVACVSIAYFIAQLGIGFSACCYATIAVTVFSEKVRGQATGLAKAYIAIASGVLATFSSCFFNPHSVDFILFIAMMIPIVTCYTAFNVCFPHFTLTSIRL